MLDSRRKCPREIASLESSADALAFSLGLGNEARDFLLEALARAMFASNALSVAAPSLSSLKSHG